MHSFVLCWHVLCGIYSSILFIFRRFVSLLEDLLKKIFSFSKRKYISFLDFPWCSIRCIFSYWKIFSVMMFHSLYFYSYWNIFSIMIWSAKISTNVNFILNRKANNIFKSCKGLLPRMIHFKLQYICKIGLLFPLHYNLITLFCFNSYKCPKPSVCSSNIIKCNET